MQSSSQSAGVLKKIECGSSVKLPLPVRDGVSWPHLVIKDTRLEKDTLFFLNKDSLRFH